MKVLLVADIEKLGWLGDVVEVNDGFARNYLLPSRLAIIPSEANLKSIAEEKARRAEGRIRERERLEEASAAVDGAEAVVAAKANEQGHLYGSVTEHDIAEHLQQEGYEVASAQVVMDEHFRMLGIFNVKLRFANNVESVIKVWVVRPEGQAGESQPEQIPEPSE